MKDFILSFFGSICPGILYNMNMKYSFWIGMSGVAGWLSYTWFSKITEQIIISTFMGAVAVGIYSESFARILKVPATIFSVSGIFPLVPGIGAYDTVQLIAADKLTEAAGKAVETAASAGSIALGVMAVSAVFRIMSRVKAKHFKRI